LTFIFDQRREIETKLVVAKSAASNTPIRFFYSLSFRSSLTKHRILLFSPAFSCSTGSSKNGADILYDPSLLHYQLLHD